MPYARSWLFLYGIADLRHIVCWVLGLVRADVIDVEHAAGKGIAVFLYPMRHGLVNFADLFIAALENGGGKLYRLCHFEFDMLGIGG